MPDITNIEQLDLNDYEMEIAAELLESRKRASADYRNKTMYKVHIESARNVKSPWGAAQVELQIKACDDEGTPVGRALMQWIGYPVNSKTAETKMDAETMRRLRDELGSVLRAKNPEEFAFYGSIEGTGRARKYFDRDGNLLTPEAKLIAQREGQAKLMRATRDLMADPSMLVGPAGYAEFVRFTKKSGKEATKFQNWSRTPNPKLPLITDVSEFYRSSDENQRS